MTFESLQKVRQSEYQVQQAQQQLQEYELESQGVIVSVEDQRRMLREREAAVQQEKQRLAAIVEAAKEQHQLAMSCLDDEKQKAAEFVQKGLPELEKRMAKMNKLTEAYRAQLAELVSFCHEMDQNSQWIYNRAAFDTFHIAPREVLASLPVFAKQPNGRLAVISEQEDRGLTPL